jgi:hypothetical protein
MRTKTLLLTAALSAAGVATSMAQVFSVNAVGYVVKTVPANGFALISNPLKAADNTIEALFKGAPVGTTVYKYNGTGFDTAAMDPFDLNFGANGKLTVMPGEGVFVKNPTAQALTFTFVGEVVQGATSNPLPKGLSIRSSIVPQSGSPAQLKLDGAPGDTIYKWDPAGQKYITIQFDPFDLNWSPAFTLDVGEAFFISKAAASTWNRTFDVNNPN